MSNDRPISELREAMKLLVTNWDSESVTLNAVSLAAAAFAHLEMMTLAVDPPQWAIDTAQKLIVKLKKRSHG